MAGYIQPTALPLSRPLTQIFNDNKRLYEELVQTRGGSPDASPLFLKLRIQKDRLIAWGIQWADRSKADDIDGSLGRAGINDLVASIMDSIKVLLEEAESLNPAAAARAEDLGEKARGKMAVTHHSHESIRRLEEINRDLTTSIDTLCDLSRTRLEPPEESRMREKALKEGVRQYVDEKARRIAEESAAEVPPAQRFSDPPFSSGDNLTDLTFMQTTLFQAAPQARPSTDAPPTYEAIASGSEDRSAAIFTVPKETAGQHAGDMPVLLDYRRAEGLQSHNIRPNNARYEKLLLALLKSPAGQNDEYTGFLKLTGWTLDQARQRYAFVYSLPEPKARMRRREAPHPRSLLSFLQNGGDTESQNVPCLEHRFRLATNVALSMLHLHELGISHGNINSNNVIFFLAPQLASSQDRIWKSALIRKPYLTGFHHLGHLTSATDRDSPLNGIYYPPGVSIGEEHPFDLAHDMYGLGLLLLEIGLWMPIGRFFKSKYSREDFRARLQTIYLKKLAHKVGTQYMGAVLHCMTAGDVKENPELSPAQNNARALALFKEKVLDVLVRCCLMDPDQTPIPLHDPTATNAAQHLEPTIASGQLQREMSEISVEEQEATTTKTGKRKQEDPSISQCITVWSHEIPSLYRNYWQTSMYPKLEKILRKAISRWETYSIDVFMSGADEETARPTLYMECTSTKKVRRILQHLNKELRLFDIRVVPGQITRSKARKMKTAKRPQHSPDGYEDLNPLWQEKPLSGASIGAYLNDHHLPPVSFGGTVLVDGEPFGMSVHHMLEDDEETQLDLENVIHLQRSMAPRDSDSVSSLRRATSNLSLLTSTVNDDADSVRSEESGYDSEDSDFDPENMYPFNVDDAPLYDDPLDVDDHDDDFWLADDFDVDQMSDDEDENEADPGDTSGIAIGDGEHLTVTQPALDDVGSGFFPTEEDKDFEHLCTHAFGYVHASSGLRRARHEDLIHEIDWALIRINDHRLADPENTLPPVPGQRAPTPTEKDGIDNKTVKLVPSAELANRAVHCHGRTSGFATGAILPAMRLVRMPGRVSPSHSWQVRGKFGPGGDSGAWVIDTKTGGVCGHVLAYSEASGVAYIAPMEVMMEDMQRTLGKTVVLPGQAAEVSPGLGATFSGKAAVFTDRNSLPLTTQNTSPLKMGYPLRQMQSTDTPMTRSDSKRSSKVQSVYMDNCQVIGDEFGRLQASC